MSNERAALAAAAEALGVPMDTLAQDRLLRYLELLRRWNRVYNLTSVRDAESMQVRHGYDSLAAVQPLRRQLSVRSDRSRSPEARLLDVGSGPGLPGIIFAICCSDLQVDCIDAVGKKVAFIRQVAIELSLPNVHAVHGRVEALGLDAVGGSFDVISARAFASLERLVRCSAHLLTPQGVWLAMKGTVPTDEIGALPSFARMFHVEPLAVPHLTEPRCIVWMRKTDSAEP